MFVAHYFGLSTLLYSRIIKAYYNASIGIAARPLCTPPTRGAL